MSTHLSFEQLQLKKAKTTGPIYHGREIEHKKVKEDLSFAVGTIFFRENRLSHLCRLEMLEQNFKTSCRSKLEQRKPLD